MESTEPQTMPAAALAAAIPVLAYTFFCLFCAVLLMGGLFINRERYSYVALFSFSTMTTTVVSILQQSNNIANWHEMRVAQYEASIHAKDQPQLALGPMTAGWNANLFWTQSYLYQVDAMLMMCWAIGLNINIWDWRHKTIAPYETHIGIASKLASFILPAVLAVLRHFFEVDAGLMGTLIIINILLLFAFTAGAFAVILILIKYLSIRLQLRSYGSRSVGSGSGGSSNLMWLKRRIDPWLVTRFMIAWCCMSAFEVILVLYCLYRYRRVRDQELASTPNFSARASITDILSYIPAPTSSLLAFLIFGTTPQLRGRYRAMFSYCFGWCTCFCCCCGGGGRRSPDVEDGRRCGRRAQRPLSYRVDGSQAKEWSRMTNAFTGTSSTTTCMSHSVLDPASARKDDYNLQSEDFERITLNDVGGILKQPMPAKIIGGDRRHISFDRDNMTIVIDEEGEDQGEGERAESKEERRKRIMKKWREDYV